MRNRSRIFTASEDFDFEQCLVFLGRSRDECLFTAKESYLQQAIRTNGQVYLLEISAHPRGLQCAVLNQAPHQQAWNEIQNYLANWLDFCRDLQGFYELAREDDLLKQVVPQYRGLRLIGIPDFWEGLAWAIIGQQINLAFAYRLKARLVENFGGKWHYNGSAYHFFPACSQIAALEVNDLRALQFSRSKAEYLINLARCFDDGRISLAQLKSVGDYEAQKAALMKLRGVGEWTADYVLMKCLRVPVAVPLQDAGLRAALRNHLQLDDKPTIEQISKIAAGWGEWAAYATFYLWRSLI